MNIITEVSHMSMLDIVQAVCLIEFCNCQVSVEEGMKRENDVCSPVSAPFSCLLNTLVFNHCWEYLFPSFQPGL